METDKRDMRDQQEMHASNRTEDADLNTDKTVSGSDIAEENMENRRHHVSHVSRKHENYRNHSSADDQPHVNSSW